jgi:oxygen-independent coproporphyrinogen-3 oxidase
MSGSFISLYVHIPFCLSKCRYCDFYSETGQSNIDKYIDALGEEWRIISAEKGLADKKIRTLYFGGGTPSLLTCLQWERIGELFINKTDTADNFECTVECNPDSFTSELAERLAGIGVTRLTFGIQSLNDRELRFLGRRHSAAKAFQSINDKSLDKFQSIGADLMYGIPGQTLESFDNSLIRVLGSSYVKHLSAYELTVNPATPFGRHISILPLPDEDTVVEMTKLALTRSKEFWFDQYEISNYAKPGFSCRHNEIYWEHEPYIGIGCAAHSYLHPYRWSNIKSVDEYFEKLNAGELPLESTEKIDNSTMAREMIFLGLRRVKGINTEQFRVKTGMDLFEIIGEEKPRNFQMKGLLNYSHPYISLTTEGMLFADAISREFLTSV